MRGEGKAIHVRYTNAGDPRRHRHRRQRRRTARGRHRHRWRPHRRNRQDRRQRRRGNRCQGHARHPGFCRPAHALRRAGHLGQPYHAVLEPWRHHRADRQLRRRLCAMPPGAARDAGGADGRRRGHPRGRADRGPAVELADIPGFSRRARPAPLRSRCGDTGAARRAAGLRHGPARRRSRAGDGGRPRRHGAPRCRGHPRRRARLLHLAHHQPQDARRAAHPDAAGRRGGAYRDRPRGRRNRQRLAAGDRRFR